MEIFPRISPFGDRTLLLEFSPDINPQTLGAMQVFLQLLASAQIPGLKELIPSYSSLLVGYDPFIWSFPTLSSALREILKQKETSPGPNSPVKRVPVVYGKEYGPDLAYVAQYHKISTAEVVTWHSSTLYRVYAIGGFPGLPAMGIEGAQEPKMKAASKAKKPASSKAKKPAASKAKKPAVSKTKAGKRK
jgi:inhibitor of KinA